MSARTVLLLHSSAGRYGADRQLALLASGLDRSRFAPLVVLPQRGPLGAELERAGVEVLVRRMAVLRRQLLTPGGLAGLAGGVLAEAGALAQLVRRRDVALVHSNTSVILAGAPAAALARRPHVLHVREIYDGFGAAWPVYRNLLLRGAAALPCVSAATAEQFGDRARARARVRVIHDGLAIAATAAPRPAARAALGIDPAAPTIAVLGRISDWKGQDVLVRALAQPPLASIGAIGLLAGDPWPGMERHLEGVLGLASALGVRGRLAPLGFREDVENVYGAADVIAVPSTRPDPLPGAAIEALAAGCAVIASAHGGLLEIIDDGRTGRLVAPGDPAALARVARELLDDAPQRARLGAAGAAQAPARFAPARLLDEIQTLYDELC